MNHQAELDNVRMDIQAVDFELDQAEQQRIFQALAKLRRYYSGDVITADVYMKQEENHPANEKTLRIRVGVPGKDAFAEDRGNAWAPLLKSVTEKLTRQLEKRK